MAALAGQDAASRQSPNQLLGEERIAVALPCNVGDDFIQRRVVAGQIADEPVDIAAIQLAQRQLAIVRKAEPGARPARPVVEHDDEVGVARGLDDGFQKILTGLIQPVQVLEDDHRRPRAGRLDHTPDDAEQTPPPSFRVDVLALQSRDGQSEKIRQKRQVVCERRINGEELFFDLPARGRRLHQRCDAKESSHQLKDRQ